MPVERFLRYQGNCYDVGTRLRFRTSVWDKGKEGVIEWFSHNSMYIRLTDGRGWEIHTIWPLDNVIIEILEPVYYKEPPKECTRGGPRPPENEIFLGWVWYIVIMLIGVIFNDRWLIWIFATVIFFLWKNGYLNGGKK